MNLAKAMVQLCQIVQFVQWGTRCETNGDESLARQLYYNKLFGCSLVDVEE